MGALEVRGDLADHVAKRTAKRRGAALDQRDVEPQLAADGRDLGPGEAAADDEHTPRLLGEQRMELLCVTARAHGDDAIERAFFGDRPRTAADAGGDHHAVVVDASPVGERDLPLLAIETRRRHAQQPLDAVEVAQPWQPGLPRRCEAEWDLLRQRRAVVGRLLLVADDGDRAVVTDVAQRLCRSQPRQRRTDDHDAGVGGKAAVTVPHGAVERSSTSTRIAPTGHAAAARNTFTRIDSSGSGTYINASLPTKRKTSGARNAHCA